MSPGRPGVEIGRLLDAGLGGRGGRHDLTLAGARVERVERHDATASVPTTTGTETGTGTGTGNRTGTGTGTGNGNGTGTLALDGRAVVPAFVDAHVHLDKAYQLHAGHALHTESSDDPVPTDVDGVIRLMGELRSSPHAADVALGAQRAIDQLVRNGTTAARVQVEVDPAVGMDLVELQQQLAAAHADRIDLQLVAFPQRGLAAEGMADLLARAMDAGLDVVGGCPYADPDPVRHLDLVFALAERHGAPVDLHLDFGDDPSRSLLRLVAERTHAHGMQGQVSIGHVTTLAAMAPDARAEALELLATAGISLVIMPATDLHLTGHGDPGTRSLAPIDRAADAGVRVAIANNNIANPFAPFGNANLLQAAWLAGIVGRGGDPASCTRLLDAITAAPAAILGLDPHGPFAGGAAHLAVLDTLDADTAVLAAPTVLATLRAGHLVDALVGVTAGPTGPPPHG